MSNKQQHIIAVCLLATTVLGCGLIGFVEQTATLPGVSYWAAQTETPVPTVTQFLGWSTPVYADTPVPNVVTTTPEWTTVTATPIVPPATLTPWGFMATPYWVTTTPAFITETPQPPVTTTPSLPMIGFTTPVPLPTATYRRGSFYMHSDVYVGGSHGLVFRIVEHEVADSPHDSAAAYHYLTLEITNYMETGVVVPASDLFYIRHVIQDDTTLTGRWLPQNEPLIARNLPSYTDQQLAPIATNETRRIILGFVVPVGSVEQVGLITQWQRPLEGGLPVWFYLSSDPGGPFVDAVHPPPPTPAVLDAVDFDGASGGGSWSDDPPTGRGMWPTTGTISRGFGCQPFFTGVDGTGFGCPPEQPWFHNGVDIANSNGTTVWSPVDGSLLYAGPNPTGPDCSALDGSRAPHHGLGNYQKIVGPDTLHYFGHLSSFNVIGGSVSASQTTAAMGSTGCSTGSHLHWIVYENSNLIDPADWAGEGP